MCLNLFIDEFHASISNLQEITIKIASTHTHKSKLFNNTKKTNSITLHANVTTYIYLTTNKYIYRPIY